jgi:YidC/Oxa1 family membrane protein insertase
MILEFVLFSTLLLSGVLLLIAFFLFNILYARRAAAASPASPAARVSSRPKDYGYLAPVARPLEWTLREVEARTTHRAGRSSWGWAIVLTTFFVNLILLPFLILAARNANAMRALQPQIDAINARYKRKGLNLDPEHSREISEVYKQHGASPLAGCIPALAPFAVLVAFYSVLTGIAELHGAHWLWIADLSKPEQLPAHSATAHDCDPTACSEDHAPSRHRPAHDPPDDADAAGLRNRALSAAQLAYVVLAYQQPLADGAAGVAR